jgi:hypothetical protein
MKQPKYEKIVHFRIFVRNLELKMFLGYEVLLKKRHGVNTLTIAAVVEQ